jgi:predicted hotdog family 3-hydroxylacyl-ACP dehydratase
MIDIESLIPHREPIKIITEVVELNDDSGIEAAFINERWPLCTGRTVHSLVLIEAIAQTAAVVEGYKRKKEGKSGAKGWLVGIKSAEFKRDVIAVDTRIMVFVNNLYAFDRYGVIEGVVKSGDDVLLTAVLQAICLNNDED